MTRLSPLPLTDKVVTAEDPALPSTRRGWIRRRHSLRLRCCRVQIPPAPMCHQLTKTPPQLRQHQPYHQLCRHLVGPHQHQSMMLPKGLLLQRKALPSRLLQLCRGSKHLKVVKHGSGCGSGRKQGMQGVSSCSVPATIHHSTLCQGLKEGQGSLWVEFGVGM